MKTDGAPTAASHKIKIIPTLPGHKEIKVAPDSSEKSKSISNEADKKGSAAEGGKEKVQEKKEVEEKLPSPSPPSPSSSLPAAASAVKLNGPEEEGDASVSRESEVKDALPSPSAVVDSAVKEEEKKVDQERKVDQEKKVDQEPLPSTTEAAATANENEGKTEDEFVVVPKLPLRTAEAEAALDRVRAIQQRRRHLYDRAIARQENKLKPLSTQSETADETPALPSSSSRLPMPSGNRYQNEEEIERDIDNINDDRRAIDALEIPTGMSFLELRERAVAANKAAAASATAAHRAASASALAADAADTATHAAQQASLAAARCQGALDMRSADAIEEAFKAATEAEEKAESASRKAAVNSAKAIINKRDAKKKEEIASKAAALSTPHGILARTSAFWRQFRRNAASAMEKTEENVQAGVVAAGWLCNQGFEKVQYVGKGAVNGMQNAWKAVQERLPAPGDNKTLQGGKLVKKGSDLIIEKKEEPRRGWFGRSRVRK